MAYVVKVNNGTISRMVRVGEGNRWTKKKAERIEAVARRIVPKRTRTLERSHRTTQNRNRLGQFQTGFSITANARHAAWVHGGTQGPIRSRSGKKMPVGFVHPTFGYRGVVYRSTVAGQRANPWLERAAHIVGA